MDIYTHIVTVQTYMRCCEHDIYEGCCIVHHEALGRVLGICIHISMESYGTNKIHIRVGIEYSYDLYTFFVEEHT